MGLGRCSRAVRGHPLSLMRSTASAGVPTNMGPVWSWTALRRSETHPERRERERMKKNQIAKRLALLLKKSEQFKKVYAEIDLLTDQLVKQKITEIEKIVIIDNFALKNKVFKTTSIKRYEAKII